MAQLSEDGTLQYDDIQEAYLTTYTFNEWGLAFRASKKLSKNDQYGLIKKVPAMFSYSAKMTRNRKVWNILNLAFTSGVTYADGVVLCSASHPLKKTGANFSNTLGAVALTTTSLQSAKIIFKKMLGDNGLEDVRTPMYLVVPVELGKTAQEIIDTTKGEPYTASNQINVHAKSLSVIESRFLTSSTAWFVTGAKPPDMSGDNAEFEPDSHMMRYIVGWPDNFDLNAEDFDSKGIKMSIDYSGAYGADDFRGLVGSSGA